MPLNCPFTNTACVEAACKFWNAELEQISSGNIVLGECTILCTTTQIPTDVRESNVLLKHIHGQHLHPINHDSDEAEQSPKGPGYGLTYNFSRANVLVSEYFGNEDMDGDGMIFGKTFLIDCNDPGCPMIIKQVMQSSNLLPSQFETVLTWDQFLNGES